MASSRIFVLQVRKMDANLGKSALMRIARLMNGLAKVQKEWSQKCSGYVEED